MWTRTDDRRGNELCCVPFFTYGLSLGDIITITNLDGAHRVESTSGHRTIRVAVQDQRYAHERHAELRGTLAAIGVLREFRGHASAYGAVDIADQGQADAVIGILACSL
jgi:hypothetical protein